MGRRRWLSLVVMVLSGSLACAGRQATAVAAAQAVAPAQPVAAPTQPAPAVSHSPAPVRPAPISIAPDGFEVVFVKGGCFNMGNSGRPGGPEERPVHEVCLDDFYIGRFEVTRDQWVDNVGIGAPWVTGEGDSRPVEMVSWDDTQVFLAKLNARRRDPANLSGTYRLPTEAEWEYAARSGGKDEQYAGEGTDVDRLGWHHWNSGVTHEVGRKAPNGLGLYDMSGNVWEWTADWYGETYYSTSPRANPTGPSTGDQRVLRGGSAGCPPSDLRTSYRNHLPPGFRGAGKGFRVVMTVPGQAR